MAVKGFLASKTVWGAIITVAAVGAQMFGIDLGDQTGWLTDLVALAGAGMSIYGRIKAVKRIGGVV